MKNTKELKIVALALFQSRFKAYHTDSSYIRAKLLDAHSFNNWANRDLSARGNSKDFWQAVIKWCSVEHKEIEPCFENSYRTAREIRDLDEPWEREIDEADELLEASNECSSNTCPVTSLPVLPEDTIIGIECVSIYGGDFYRIDGEQNATLVATALDNHIAYCLPEHGEPCVQNRGEAYTLTLPHSHLQARMLKNADISLKVVHEFECDGSYAKIPIENSTEIYENVVFLLEPQKKNSVICTCICAEKVKTLFTTRDGQIPDGTVGSINYCYAPACAIPTQSTYGDVENIGEYYKSTIGMLLLAFNIKLTTTVIELYCAEISEDAVSHRWDALEDEADELGTQAMYLGFDANELPSSIWLPPHTIGVPSMWHDWVNACIGTIQPILQDNGFDEMCDLIALNDDESEEEFNTRVMLEEMYREPMSAWYWDTERRTLTDIDEYLLQCADCDGGQAMLDSLIDSEESLEIYGMVISPGYRSSGR